MFLLCELLYFSDEDFSLYLTPSGEVTGPTNQEEDEDFHLMLTPSQDNIPQTDVEQNPDTEADMEAEPFKCNYKFS